MTNHLNQTLKRIRSVKEAKKFLKAEGIHSMIKWQKKKKTFLIQTNGQRSRVSNIYKTIN
jgi:hypothetical protein